LGLHHFRERHHAAVLVADIQLHQIVDLHARLRLRLHDDLLHAARIGKSLT
jgi:hypothetical protein